jgi:hypothetical protein
MRKAQWGTIRLWDEKRQVGWIHYAHKEKNLRFTAADLRGIEKPAAGMMVAFYRNKLDNRAFDVRPWEPAPAQPPQDADGGLPAA